LEVALVTPYADVRAADLVLALDAPAAPALGVLRLEIAGVDVELRLLGHSHQVAVSADGLALRETVACRPGLPGDLPDHRSARQGPHRYAFAATIDSLDRAAAAAVAQRVAADPNGLVGVFPGEDGAFTALRAGPAATPGTGVSWETWHVYPQSGELVHTTGTVVRP